MATIAVAGPDRVADVEPLTRSLHEHHVAVDPAIPGIPPRDTDGWWEVRRGAGRYEREGFRPWVVLNLGKVPEV